MTKSIQIAEDYKSLKKVINTFDKKFLNYAIIPVFLTAFLFSLMFFLDFHHGDLDGDLSTFLHGLSSFFLLVITFSASSASIFMSLSQYFGNNRSFVISYKKYYQNEFTDIEKSFLENLLDDKFNNIIQQNRKDIKKKLIDAKQSMEKEIFTLEYLETLKRDIEANLQERKQYIPTLQAFAQEYNSRDNDNVMMELANQQLSKAGISTFRTKAKPNFEIIEESS